MHTKMWEFLAFLADENRSMMRLILLPVQNIAKILQTLTFDSQDGKDKLLNMSRSLGLGIVLLLDLPHKIQLDLALPSMHMNHSFNMSLYFKCTSHIW